MLLRCLATRVKMLQHLWLSNSATVATYPFQMIYTTLQAS
uniref:Uncharacterized protein n=1 Tax=Anguilla anguilla TaxID=7936 RepID=A0A0E9QRS6_ANGAN